MSWFDFFAFCGVLAYLVAELVNVMLSDTRYCIQPDSVDEDEE